MQHRFVRFLSFLMVLPLCGLMHAPLLEDSFHAEGVTVAYYDITVRNLDDARSQMVTVGPLDPFGARRFAAVTWKIQWRWNPQGGQQALRQVQVRPQITVTLPRFAYTTDTPGAEITKLQRLFGDIERHEKNHLRRVLMTVAMMREALSLEAQAPDASAESMNKVAQKLISDNNGWDRWYDEQTFHGRSEGVF
jgi:predicted secreted Zn-dependent protease